MMELRDYQQEDVTAVARLWKQGAPVFPIVEHATGLGKTPVLATLAQHAYLFLNVRVLILAHRRELITQAEAELCKFAPALVGKIGRVMEGYAEYGAPVVVATIQSVSRSWRKLGAIGCVLIDEAHHARAASYKTLLKNLQPAYKCGVTGTPAPLENMVLVGQRGLKWGIDNGWLCPLDPYSIQVPVDLSGVHVRQGDFISGELAAVMETQNAYDLAAQAWQTWGDNRPTLAFCTNKQGAYSLLHSFSRRGARACVLTGENTDDERNQAKEDLQTGALKVAITIGIWTEGVNIPHASCLLMCRPTLSRTLYMQMLGRGTRKSEGKSDCRILDLCPYKKGAKLLTTEEVTGQRATKRTIGKRAERNPLPAPKPVGRGRLIKQPQVLIPTQTQQETVGQRIIRGLWELIFGG